MAHECSVLRPRDQDAEGKSTMSDQSLDAKVARELMDGSMRGFNDEGSPSPRRGHWSARKTAAGASTSPVALTRASSPRS